MCQAEEFGGHQWPETPSLEDASVSCGEGVSGSYNRTCLASGDWDAAVHDYCENPLTCPTELLDGIQWPETLAGQSSTVNCPTGQSGQKTRLCNASGQWEQPTGVCSRNDEVK